MLSRLFSGSKTLTACFFGKLEFLIRRYFATDACCFITSICSFNYSNMNQAIWLMIIVAIWFIFLVSLTLYSRKEISFSKFIGSERCQPYPFFIVTTGVWYSLNAALAISNLLDDVTKSKIVPSVCLWSSS